MNLHLTYGRSIMILLVLAVALRLANLGGVAARTPDERVYTRRSNVWLESGIVGMHQIARDFEIQKELPPPVRIGLFQLTAWTMQLTGLRDPFAGAIVSCAASIGSVMILALMCFRFFPPGPSLCALLFYAVSPLELDAARRAWVDTPVELAVLAMLYLACEISLQPGGRLPIVLFALVGSAGLTLKESMPLPFGLCAVWVFWELLRSRNPWNVALLIGSALACSAAAVAWMAYAIGNFGELVHIVKEIPAIIDAPQYTKECCTGSPHLLVQAFWVLTPCVCLLIPVGIYAIVRPSRAAGIDLRSVRSIAAVSLTLVLFTALTWMNLRYLTPSLGPLYLLAGFGVEYLYTLTSSRVREMRVRQLLASGVLAAVWTIALSDYVRFERIFVRNELPDPSMRALIDIAPQLR
jgi:4-amino-4-deoxy-L-arabinose transferase-like glycosyltransferase